MKNEIDSKKYEKYFDACCKNKDVIKAEELLRKSLSPNVSKAEKAKMKIAERKAIKICLELFDKHVEEEACRSKKRISKKRKNNP